MGYDINCRGCGHNYYTIGSSTWYTSGTVTVYPSYGYCCCCGVNETNYGCSWSGNVVKVECAACSNLITVVTSSDWNGSSSESAGYCSGCRNKWLNKKQSYENLKSRASSCSWASVGWDGYSGYSSLCNANCRIKCYTKSHSVYSGSNHSSISSYFCKSRCPECVRYEATKSKSNFCPDYYTFSAPGWARVTKTIDAGNWLWTHCEIYCNKNNHCAYYKTSFDQDKSGGYFHNEITKILSMNECPKCTKEEVDRKAEEKRKKDAAKLASDALQKSNDFVSKSNELFNKLKHLDSNDDTVSDTKSAETETNSDELDIMEQKWNDYMNNAKSKLAQLEDTITNSNDIVDEVCKLQTIETQKKMQEIMGKIREKQDEILKAKQILRDEIKATNDELIKNSKAKMQADKDLIKEKEKENELNNVDKEAEALQKEISLSGKERNANPAAAQQMDQKYNKLLKTLKEKHQSNKEKSESLKNVGERIQCLKAKLIAHQSKNKYVLQCLDVQYTRLQETAQGVAVKYEQRVKYFMTVTCNLSEKVMDKFNEEELDQDMGGILDLEMEDLIEMGIKKLTAKRILKKIVQFKEENNI